MSDETPAPVLERTNTAVKLAEQTIEGPKKTPTIAVTNGEVTSVIAKAMEFAQPGSSKKPVKPEEETKTKPRKPKKKGKKEKGEKAESNSPPPVSKRKLLTQAESDSSGEKPMQVSVKHLEERYDEQGYTHIQEPGAAPPEKSKEDQWADFVLCELRHFNYENKYTHRTLEVKSRHLKEVLKSVIGEYPGISFRTHKIKLEFPLHCLYHYLDELTAELEVLKKAKEAKAAKEPKKDKKKKGEKKDKKDKKKKDKKKDEEESEKEEKTEEEANEEEVKDEKKDGKEKSDDKKEVDEEKKQKGEEEAIEHLEFLVKFLDNEFQETIKDCKNLLPHGLITYEL